MPNTPFVETGDIQSVGYDSNPNEGWGEQVKDEEDDDTSDGPIGDAIIPFLMCAVVVVKETIFVIK